MNTWYCIRRTSAVAAAAAALAAGEAAPTEAEVWIYGDIGESWYGETVAAKDFVKELAALDAQKIKLRINSYGGSVSDGLAIYNALKRHPASIHASVDGIAASIASLIFMAADEREIADNAQLMIHAPWAYVAGNSAELREFADRLDLWAKSMASSYASATGMTEDEVMAWLTDGKDHYFTAAEAVAQKLATTTASAMPVAASATRHAWAARKPAVQTPAPAAANAAPNTPTQYAVPAAANPEPSMTPEQAAAIKAAAKAENDRQAAIRAAFQPHLTRNGAQAALDAAVADLDCDVVKAKAKLLDVLAAGSTPSGSGHVVTLEDESDKRKKALASAIEIRAGVAKNDTSNPYRGHTLVEVARASLAMAGVKTDGLDKMGMIALAFTHSTGDFPLLLSGVAQKAMLKGYDEAEETFQLWTSKGTLPDFKPMTNVDIGSFPALRRVREGGEYKYITVGERAETRVLAIPVVTKLGEWFNTVGPAAVVVLRGAIGGLTSVFWGLKNAVTVAWEVLNAMVYSVAEPLRSLVAGLYKVITGDFQGAQQEPAEWPERVGQAWSTAWGKIVASSEEARDRLGDLFSESAPAASPAAPGGKSAKVKPKEDDSKEKVTQSFMQYYEAALAEEKRLASERDALRDYTKEEELAFWRLLLDNLELTNKDRVAITRKADTNTRMAAVVTANELMRTNYRSYSDQLLDLAGHEPWASMYAAGDWSNAAFAAQPFYRRSDGVADDNIHPGDAAYARIGAIAARAITRVRVS